MCPASNGAVALDEFLSRLETYVNLDTPSGDKPALDLFSDRLKGEFEDAGCRVTVHERTGGNLLECRVGDGSRQILLLGHMDTVFPRGTAATRPFSRVGDELFGPGVLDMKSGVLMILEILRYYADKLPAEWSLCALLNCDEEIGSRQSRELIIGQAQESAACLCMEPSKPGYCTVARKGMMTFQLKVKGVAAHSGVNYLTGHSAIQAIAHIIERLYALRDDETGVSVNVGGLSGGAGRGNVVAESAELLGETRFYRPEDGERLAQALEGICADTGDPEVTTELAILSRRPPMQQTGASRALYGLARRAAERNGLSLGARTHGGGSDGALAASTGIPVIDGMGAEGEFSHTEQEYVRADTLLNRIQTCIDLIGMLLEDQEKGSASHE